MRRMVGPGSSRPLLVLLVVVILFGFTPISRVLLSSVDGSFTPTPYSSLALSSPSDAAVGIVTGQAVLVKLTNRTGHTEAYHWRATQDGALISLGEETLENGRTSTISVPSRDALTGKLQIALTGTNIFVTVPIRKR
jgi:hypothetical protein